MAGIGVIIGLAVAVWLLASLSEGTLRATGAILGFVLLLIIVLPLLGGGTFLFVRGTREAREYAEIAKEQRLLDIVQTRGQVRISELVLEMRMSMDQVKEYIYDLVGKGLFTGYINWDDGILYAKTAKEMRTTKCPNCGGIREVVGKGVVKCPYCGTELFVG